MVSYRKTVTKKTGPNTRQTITYTPRGITRSYSYKGDGSNSRRTVSYNNRTGRTRKTYTTIFSTGWRKMYTKTTGGEKCVPKKMQSFSTKLKNNTFRSKSTTKYRVGKTKFSFGIGFVIAIMILIVVLM